MHYRDHRHKLVSLGNFPALWRAYFPSLFVVLSYLRMSEIHGTVLGCRARSGVTNELTIQSALDNDSE